MPRNETEAFEGLFRELYRPLLGFFTRRGCSPEECRDLAQAALDLCGQIVVLSACDTAGGQPAARRAGHARRPSTY